MFQSSLRPKAERNIITGINHDRSRRVSILAPPEGGAQLLERLCLRPVGPLFQSSLRPKAERNALRGAVLRSAQKVSILAPPEGGAQPWAADQYAKIQLFQSSLRPKAERNP